MKDFDGECMLTQDTYDIFNSHESNLLELDTMHILEALTESLDNYKDPFILENSKSELNYNKIKFNVCKDQNLTVGDAEFICTFRNVEKNISNINDYAQKIVDRLKTYTSYPVSSFIGSINISYTKFFANTDGTKPYKSKTYTDEFDIFEVKLLDSADQLPNIYMLVKSSIVFNKKNIYDYISCYPQITLGMPLVNVREIAIKIVEFEMSSKKYITYAMDKVINSLLESTIEKLNTDKHVNHNKINLINENYDIILNYLFFYYSYVNIAHPKNYLFKNGDLTIHKYSRDYLPRQHFHEILDLTPHLRGCIMIIYETNFDWILSYRLQYIQWIISDKPNIFTFVPELTPIEPNFYDHYESDAVVRNNFNSYIRKKFPEIDERSSTNLIEILICDLKMFIGIKNKSVDQITTFTTRIQYDGTHILFEYRHLTDKTRNALELSHKINKFNRRMTLNNIEFVINRYKSSFVFSNLSKEKQEHYNRRKIDHKQTEIKNLNEFLKNLNTEMSTDDIH